MYELLRPLTLCLTIFDADISLSSLKVAENKLESMVRQQQGSMKQVKELVKENGEITRKMHVSECNKGNRCFAADCSCTHLFLALMCLYEAIE